MGHSEVVRRRSWPHCESATDDAQQRDVGTTAADGPTIVDASDRVTLERGARDL